MQAAKIKRCYNAELAADRTLAGKMSVKIRLGDNGGVCSTEMHGSEMPDTLDRCALRVFGEGSYPAPLGGCVDVVVPLSFQAMAPDGGLFSWDAGAPRR
jgi:hypothetical protein